jgi:hypothetical protein
MAISLEAYLAEGIRRGVIGSGGRLDDLLETLDELRVTGGHLAPLDGSRPVPDPAPGVTLPVDDLLVVVAPPDTPVPVHPAWHDVALTCGPYVVTGRMPTMPGFDPARALTRPTGMFVLLDQVRLTLASDPGGGSIDIPLAWVNRYVVETVESDLDLGTYYPGARCVVSRGFRSGEEAGPAA